MRDYSRYNKEDFTNLIINSDWSEYDLLLDPNLQWEILLSNVLNVLSIMCPYKRVFARKEIVPWLTPEIYKALQDKKNSIKKYRDSKSSGDLTLAKIAQNKTNMLIEKAKRTFIKNSLKVNGKNPKKFWRIINNMIKNGNLVNIENITFVNEDSHEPVLKSNVPDFFNSFFANIAESTRLFNESNVPELDPNMTRENMFEFLPPSIHEIKDLAGQIDTNNTSCVEGVNAKTCKALIEIIPSKFVKLFANSMFTGIFPRKWACAKLTFLPKDGNSSNP